MTISAPYIDVTTGDMIISLSKPLMENGVRLGVLACDIKTEMMQQAFSNYKADDGSYLFLMDAENHLLSHGYEEYQPTDKKMLVAADTKNSEILTQASASALPKLYKDYDGADKYSLAVYEENTSWTIGFIFPREIITQQLFYQGLVSFSIFLVALIIGIGVIIWILKKALLRLRALYVQHVRWSRAT